MQLWRRACEFVVHAIHDSSWNVSYKTCFPTMLSTTLSEEHPHTAQNIHTPQVSCAERGPSTSPGNRVQAAEVA